MGRVQKDETVRSEPEHCEGERPTNCLWQIVADPERHGSAKPVFGGSIPPVASIELSSIQKILTSRGCSSVVERFLAKEEVAGSIPVARSIKLSLIRAERDVPSWARPYCSEEPHQYANKPWRITRSWITL